MSNVEVLIPGRRVRVYENLTNDVLEYAEALIEEEGWNKGMRAEKGKPAVFSESSKSTGWTLHDAIGEANTRLFGNKEGAFIDSESSRATAVAAVQSVLPKGQDDKMFNDKARSKSVVIDVLRRAREGATV